MSGTPRALQHTATRAARSLAPRRRPAARPGAPAALPRPLAALPAAARSPERGDLQPALPDARRPLLRVHHEGGPPAGRPPPLAAVLCAARCAHGCGPQPPALIPHRPPSVPPSPLPCQVTEPGSVAPRTLYGVCCYVRELVHRPPSMAREVRRARPIGWGVWRARGRAALPLRAFVPRTECALRPGLLPPPRRPQAYPGCTAPLSRYLVVAPRCYCLLTHHPFFALHFRVRHRGWLLAVCDADRAAVHCCCRPTAVVSCWGVHPG